MHFSKTQWSKVITCQVWGNWGKTRFTEWASHRKEHLCLIICSQLICSNEADWSPILQQPSFAESHLKSPAAIQVPSYFFFHTSFRAEINPAPPKAELLPIKHYLICLLQHFSPWCGFHQLSWAIRKKPERFLVWLRFLMLSRNGPWLALILLPLRHLSLHQPK